MSEKETPLLKIGESVLLPSELARHIQQSAPSDSATQAALFLEDWRRAASLYEQALQVGENNDEETQRLVEKSRRRIIAERFVERKLQEALKEGRFRVDSTEVKTYYEQMNSALVFHDAMFKLLRIYTINADTALRLRQALVARVNADSLFNLVMLRTPETAELNQLAFESATQFKTLPQLHLESENLHAILERMKPNDVSPVLKLSDSLFVVMRLEESVAPRQPKTFAQAFPEILERLRIIKQKRFVDSLASRLKNSL
ncbi:MAG: peptidylprolyl isomerase [Chloroherpetonaceae bacterium]